MSAGGKAPTAIVTGANAGIGFHVAGQLAAKGFSVIMACRNKDKGERAVTQMKEQYGSSISVRVGVLDLASFASVRSFAASISAEQDALNLLVCNAGMGSVVTPKKEDQITKDGVDLMYQSNYLSHFLLTLYLLPWLKKTPGGRVVNITSPKHRDATADELAKVRILREPYKDLYGFSKLAQNVISFELYRRFTKESGVVFHMVNPGATASEIWTGKPAWQRNLFNCIFIQPQAAAAAVVLGCVTEEGNAPSPPKHWNGYRCAGMCKTAEYWTPCGAARGSPSPTIPSTLSSDPEFGAKLWEESILAIREAGLEITPDGGIKP